MQPRPFEGTKKSLWDPTSHYESIHYDVRRLVSTHTSDLLLQYTGYVTVLRLFSARSWAAYLIATYIDTAIRKSVIPTRCYTQREIAYKSLASTQTRSHPMKVPWRGSHYGTGSSTLQSRLNESNLRRVRERSCFGIWYGGILHRRWYRRLGDQQEGPRRAAGGWCVYW